MRTTHTLIFLGGVALLASVALPSAVAQTFYSHGDPTADEQFMLELINAARANPGATGEALASTTDPAMLRGYRVYGVDTNLLRAQFASYLPKPPLAFHPVLISVARAHTADMVNRNTPTHTGSNGSQPADRARAAGYQGAVLENAGGPGYGNVAMTENAGFLVDWGVPGVGHRVNTLDLYPDGRPALSEIGIGYGPDTWVTQDFGRYWILAQRPVYLTGVAYRDFNANGRYDQGEGIPGITVFVPGNSRYTVTGQSGGYSLPLDRTGEFNARAEGGVLAAPIQRAVSTAGDNVKWDLVWGADGTPPKTAAAPVGDNVVSVVGTAIRGGFVVSRTGNTTEALTVVYHHGGGAIAGRDYEALPGVVVIPAGAAEVVIPVRSLTGRGKVKVFLDPGAYGINKAQSKLVLADL